MTRRVRIGVVDYGAGNLVSIDQALTAVGADVQLIREAEALRGIDALIVPGVGAARPAMDRLQSHGLVEPIRAWLAADRPFLGICLGLQLLFESSTELGGAEGLGLADGRVDRLAAGGLKLPQIGWNSVSWQHQSPLVEGLPNPCPMYHVHTYAVSSPDVLGTATYGEEFVTAVERAPLYGVQFHPEKSGPHGLRLLSNFARICARAYVRAA